MSGLVECSAVYPTLAVPNVTESCNWYVEKLGFSIRFLWGDPPRHGAVLLGNACVHFWEARAQLGENWLYFNVSSVDGMYQRAKESGVDILKSPEDYPWGMREFNAVDLNGYNIRFGQHIAP